VREPANHHDARTVAVYWRDAKLGHTPRAENEAVAYCWIAADGWRGVS
jgi:hypothetical protein